MSQAAKYVIEVNSGLPLMRMLGYLAGAGEARDSAAGSAEVARQFAQNGLFESVDMPDGQWQSEGPFSARHYSIISSMHAENPEDEPFSDWPGAPPAYFSALHYAAKSEAARDGAVEAGTIATGARDVAVAARDDAEAARDLAENYASVSPRVIYVQTIADMCDLSKSLLVDGQEVLVSEYEAGRGVGGGRFVWQESATGANVTGLILQATEGGPGRWVRRYEVLTPEMCGAVGDGVADDTAAFHVALGTKETVVCQGAATYAVDDLIISGNERLDLNNATLVPASASCRWLCRLNGFDGPKLYGGYLRDTDYVTVKTGVVSGAVSQGGTSITLTDIGNIEARMVLAVKGTANGDFTLRQIESVSGNTVTLSEGAQKAIPSGATVYCSFGLVSLYTVGSTMLSPQVENLRINGGGIHLYQNAVGSADISRGAIRNIYSHGPLIAQEAILNNVHDIDRGFFQSWGARTLSGSVSATAAQTTLDVEATVGKIPIGNVFISDQVGFRINSVSQSYVSGTPGEGEYSMTADGLTVQIGTSLVGGETLLLNIFDRPFTQTLYDPHGTGTVQGAHKWLRCVYVQNHSCAMFENKNNPGGLIHLTQVNYDAGAIFNVKIANTNKFYATHLFSGYSPFPMVLDLEESIRPILINGLYTSVNTNNHFDASRVSGAQAISVTGTAAASKIDGKPKVKIDAWWGPDYSVTDINEAIGLGEQHERPSDFFGTIVQTRAGGVPSLTTRHANGTIKTPTASQNSDILAQWLILSYTGSTYAPVANIRAIADQNHDGTGYGTILQARTTRVGGVSTGISLTTRIDSVGNPRVELGGKGDTGIIKGAGSPEGTVVAPVGSMFMRTDGGAGTTLYVKESGTGNSGWVAK